MKVSRKFIDLCREFLTLESGNTAVRSELVLRLADDLAWMHKTRL